MIQLLRRENKSAKQDNFYGKNLSYDYIIVRKKLYTYLCVRILTPVKLYASTMTVIKTVR